MNLTFPKITNTIWRRHKFSTRIVTKIPHIILEHAHTVKVSCKKLFLVSAACIFSSPGCAIIPRCLAAPYYI